jgi:SAM-dependent methyltransferase
LIVLDTCQICHNQEGNQVHHVKEMMFGTREEFRYLECAACQSIQLLEVPASMDAYYPEDYYSHNQLTLSPAWKNTLKKLRLFAFKYLPGQPIAPIYGDWILQTKIKLGDKIGDIGCGSGQLLYEMSVAGYRNLWGFDPFMENPGKPNAQLTLERKDIFGINEDGSFDLLMLHHAYEHMDRPLEVMQKAYELLKPGGQLLIRIPVSDAEAWKQYGVNWVQLDAPRHLFIHSVKSVQMLAQKAGLTVDKVIFDSTAFQFWGSELYQKAIQLHGNPPLGHFSTSQMAQWESAAKKLNTEQKGDQAAFYLRKAQD